MSGGIDLLDFQRQGWRLWAGYPPDPRKYEVVEAFHGWRDKDRTPKVYRLDALMLGDDLYLRGLWWRPVL